MTCDTTTRPLHLVTCGEDAAGNETIVAAIRGLISHNLTGQSAGSRAEQPIVVPVGAHEDPHRVVADCQRRILWCDDETDLIVRTSGSSSGTGNLVAMSARALVASAEATHRRLGGPGRWVVALPTHHIAGLQMLVRSCLAGVEPVIYDRSQGFDVRSYARLLTACQSDQLPLYTSLVPTQLVRALDSPQACEALAGCQAVLVGGAALAGTVRERARTAGIPVVTTYGMSETGGGCVYDGIPLDGVQVRCEAPANGAHGAGGQSEPAAQSGRILLSGPMLAQGYATQKPGSAESPWRTLETPQGRQRWLVTSDYGVMTQGRLTVQGRVDDVVITGGIKVAPQQVESALMQHPAIKEAVVYGREDAQWGQAVCAAITLQSAAREETHGGAPGTVLERNSALVRELNEQVRHTVGAAAVPKEYDLWEQFPVLPSGKIDRHACRR